MGRRRRMAGRAGQSDQWARESAVDPLECSARDCKGACVCVFFWLHTFSKALKVCADQRCKICNGSISETFWPPTISQVPLSSGEK